MNNINCLSPIDGRYHKKTEILRPYLSEFGLIHYRLLIEIEWLKYLANISEIKEIKVFNKEELYFLDTIVINFNNDEALKVKKIENEINHDVKAIEYYVKQKLIKHKSLSKFIEFVHFGCTSEDINNLAYGLILKNVTCKIIIPKISNICEKMNTFSLKFSEETMMSRTHGQPASPTTIGKEFAVFTYRIKRQLNQFKKIEYLGKINGAVGNFNAHIAAYPKLNWIKLSRDFVQQLGLINNPLTTQIESHDYIAEYCQCLVRINNILIDFCKDIWGYISINYFNQKKNTNEIGSSTMPHKINPIDFEKAEGNLGIANSYLNFLSNKLPISRWQRDLTDSTVLRNIGVSIAHSFLSYDSIISGMEKLELNRAPIEFDLLENFEIIGEAIQTIMRCYQIKNPYEKLKDITRGKKLSKEHLIKFIDTLDVPEHIKMNLKLVEPTNYVGLASNLAKLNKNNT